MTSPLRTPLTAYSVSAPIRKGRGVWWFMEASLLLRMTGGREGERALLACRFALSLRAKRQARNAHALSLQCVVALLLSAPLAVLLQILLGVDWPQVVEDAIGLSEDAVKVG